ncbi:MAG: nuclear transport factor 2 family protein [Pseudomonadota bacterium]
MKILLLALMLFTTAPGLAVATDGTSPSGDPDTARVITLVSSIPLAVDRAAYDLAEAAFAAEVVIDYTSLWGGEPSITTPAALMDGWRGIVPGFDATWHELGPVEVSISDDTAKASAQVDARHWIGNQVWRPVGVYHWDLVRTEDGWRVSRMVFEMTQEIGDRALTEEAMARAAQ